MAILTTCPGCGTKLKAPDHLAGTKVKCLKCSSLATVPLPDDPAEPEEVLEAPPRDEEPPPGRHGKETESHRPARRTHEEYERTPTPPARRTVNALGLVALVIGVGALLFSLIPCLGFLSLPFSALGLLLSLVALVIALTGRRLGLVAPAVGTVVCLVALAMPFAMTYLIGTQPGRNLAKADQLYDSGRQAEALPLYKDNFLFATAKAKVLRRIVEEEAKQGHEEEAKTWIKKGMDLGVVVTYDDPHSQALAAEVAKNPAGTKEAGAGEPQRPADFTLTAEELWAEYQKDKQAADKKYNGKTVELSGVVKDVFQENPAFIGLAAGKAVVGLECVMIEKEPWTHVAPGQKIKIRGTETTQVDEPALFNCVVVEEGPNPSIAVTAEKLADEYAADRKGVEKKYTDKPLILSGEVVENRNDDKGRTVLLKTTNKVQIELMYGPAFEKFGAKLSPGQSVKVYGKITEFDFTENHISLDSPHASTK